jgi:hypothetical protein
VVTTSAMTVVLCARPVNQIGLFPCLLWPKCFRISTLLRSFAGPSSRRPRGFDGTKSRARFVDHLFPDTFGFENQFNGFPDRTVAGQRFRSIVRSVFYLRDGVTYGNT